MIDFVTEAREAAKTLTAAKAILLDANNWSRGRGYANDKHGNPISFSDPDATRWCLMGAVRKAGADLRTDPNHIMRALNRLAVETRREGFDGIIDFNDNCALVSHERMLAVLDRAIST